MLPPLICFHATLAPDVLLHGYLNDLPLFEGLHRGPDSRQGGANEYLVPGKNTVSLRILRAPRPRSTGAPPGEPLRFLVFTAADPVNAPRDVTILHELRYSTFLDREPQAELRPHHYTATFDLGVPVREPAFLSAAPTSVDCEGDLELHDVIADLHGAVERGDVDRFLHLTELRVRELAAAYEGHGASEGQLRDTSREFFAQHPEVEPLDPGDLHFESRASGRVVCVSRPSGRPVLEARAKDDPTRVLRINPWLIRKDGRWHIVG